MSNLVWWSNSLNLSILDKEAEGLPQVRGQSELHSKKLPDINRRLGIGQTAFLAGCTCVL